MDLAGTWSGTLDCQGPDGPASFQVLLVVTGSGRTSQVRMSIEDDNGSRRMSTGTARRRHDKNLIVEELAVSAATGVFAEAARQARRFDLSIDGPLERPTDLRASGGDFYRYTTFSLYLRREE